MTLSCIGGACRHRRPRAKDLHLDVALLDATVVDEGLTPSCHESTWAADVDVELLESFVQEFLGSSEYCS